MGITPGVSIKIRGVRELFGGGVRSMHSGGGSLCRYRLQDKLEPICPPFSPTAHSDMSAMDAEAFDDLGGIIGATDDTDGSDIEAVIHLGPAVWLHHPPPGNIAQQFSVSRAVANKSCLGWIIWVFVRFAQGRVDFSGEGIKRAGVAYILMFLCSPVCLSVYWCSCICSCIQEPASCIAMYCGFMVWSFVLFVSLHVTQAGVGRDAASASGESDSSSKIPPCRHRNLGAIGG